MSDQKGTLPLIQEADLKGNCLRLNRNFTILSGDINSLQGQVAALTPATSGLAGAITKNGQVVYGTHSQRTQNASPSTLLASLFVEIDRGNVVYEAQNITAGNAQWVFVSGIYGAALAQEPTDLGVNDAGFLFFATDTRVLSRWSGSAWVLVGSSFTNPMTTLGDILYENGVPAPARLVGNLTTTREFLISQGLGVIANAPFWGILKIGDVLGLTAPAYHQINKTGTLASANIRTAGGTVLPAGTYRLNATLSVTPTGAATVGITFTWTDDRGNSVVSTGMQFSGSTAVPVYASIPIELDGTHDLTVAVTTVTGTVTYNLTVVVEQIR